MNQIIKSIVWCLSVSIAALHSPEAAASVASCMTLIMVIDRLAHNES